MTVENNLLPCPFCGGEGFWQSEHDSDGFGVFWAIRCAGCGNGTQQHYVSNGNDCPQFRAEVRDSWNKRPDLAQETAASRATECEQKQPNTDATQVHSAVNGRTPGLS